MPITLYIDTYIYVVCTLTTKPDLITKSNVYTIALVPHTTATSRHTTFNIPYQRAPQLTTIVYMGAALITKQPNQTIKHTR